jgi:general secretion pathway protein A
MNGLYVPFFGLREEPFGMTPDPRFLFLSHQHQEGLAHLLYGLTQSGGFVELSGEVGTGKTTLIRRLLEQSPSGVEVALILNPKQTPKAFTLNLLRELQMDLGPTTNRLDLPTLIGLVYQHLFSIYHKGHRAILIVDEAQALPVETLEQIRLLTNLETRQDKLLQIVLVGQPEIDELLDGAALRPLRNRITARFHLGPLTARETAEYIAHRLAVAGLSSTLFTPGATRLIHRCTRGFPRTINILCSRTLLAAYVSGDRMVGQTLVRQAARELSGRPPVGFWSRWLRPS